MELVSPYILAGEENVALRRSRRRRRRESGKCLF
jgi:hypothetical protein